MDVGSLGTEYFTEESLLCHVERGELEEVIHAVLEHHAVTLCALCGIDYIPGFLETGDSWHFAGDVLSLLHGIDHHRSVTSPVGSDVDEVDVGAVAELLPCLFAPRVSRCLGETSLLEDSLALLYALWMEVADSLNLYTIEVSKAFDGTWTTHTQSDEAHTYDGHWGKTQTEDILLTSRTLGNSGLDEITLLGLLALRLPLGIDCSQREERSQKQGGYSLDCFHYCSIE